MTLRSSFSFSVKKNELAGCKTTNAIYILHSTSGVISMTDGKLWITYAWDNNKDGDFDYLAQELEDSGVATSYDKIALIPGRRLWDQIADNINSPHIKAWAYLITAESLASGPCREELAYAIDRTLKEKSEEFPLIGILHGVSFNEIPPALRVRLCVSLDSPDWREEIRSGVIGSPTGRTKKEVSRYIWKIHPSKDQTSGTFEIRPRFGSVSPWLIAIPKNGPQPSHWGVGPADSQHISTVQYGVKAGELSVEGEAYNYYSTENAITSSSSAYLVFSERPPSSILIGSLIPNSGFKFDFKVDITTP
ncbi:hypothetical protein ALP99_05710 [Pseudomonas syringae pv. tomato]|nr:hypothetical protein PSPTOT1_0862 [Pseudomonas syringae pv. tomato T1]RMQ71829.1 hypothetical protein ALP99_05710 [Pseudomonas syringae pv. tomato]RMQ79885.1 hypothetical protein ALQ00_05839 [Pseudomonas syringae pv. tomato]RMU94718.1 hypothetical protein ALP19_05776 [Pseudomonas syringae pv. tomato]